VGFATERDLVERALAHDDSEQSGEPVFPPVARRFLEAREHLGLTQDEVAAQWGQPPSMYWDLEFHDDEAFTVIGVRELIALAQILHVSVMHLLFGGEPSPPLAAIPYPEIARRLRARMNEQAISEGELSELVGWELAEYLASPDKLAELPIFGLRSICGAADVDWAATLANAAPARKRS